MQCAGATQPFYDRTHPSKVFGGARTYRIFLPRNYDDADRRYPVIYYLHGHSDRYTLEKYDNGLDTVPKIAAFTAGHDVIVVAVDGYVARDYTGFYGGTPYDVREEGGDFDFGDYFVELVRHIDSTYRTLTDRRHRATSGLSMGGFMSLYLSARYPELIGSASSFNPGPEFFTGEKGRRSLWRPKDHVAVQEQTMIRLIRASGDYISQYHEETRLAYATDPAIDFEFRQDEYHRHWATSIAETFQFHERAFANPKLDAVPVEWNYTSAFRNFEIRGYRVEAGVEGPALINLEHVSQTGFRIRTRQWAPDGPASNCKGLQLTTAPVYVPSASYQVVDYDFAKAASSAKTVTASSDGRLAVQLDCAGHEIGITGPGAGLQSPVLLPATNRDYLRIMAGRDVNLPIRILNPRGNAMSNIRVELTSEYPTVQILNGKTKLASLASGQMADLSTSFQIRLTAGDADFERVHLDVRLSCDQGNETHQRIDVLAVPPDLPAPLDVAIIDGRQLSLPVFRQRGNQGGGEAIERTVREGEGNGNGVLEPGEKATIWVKLKQGVDPFDKNNWCRAKVYSDSEWLKEVGDIQEPKQREWTGAMNRTSLLALDTRVPAGTKIPMILDCESWSFRFTPDVRYGAEPLYQAFQIHKHHLFSYTWVGR